MELDDFKTAWNNDAERTITRAALEQRISRVANSGRKIRRAFVAELIILSVLYLFFAAVVFLFHGQVQSFIYKLVGVTLLAFLPMSYRLYQSQLRINSIDYASDIHSNLLAFLAYYKTTLKWYWWSSVIVSVLMFILLFTDQDFLALDIEWQIGICVHILIVLFLTRPYLKKAYGRYVREFELFLE